MAIVLSVVGTFVCGRNFKIDLEDLARHNVLEHDLTFDELVTVRANRDKTLIRPLSKAHGIISRGEVALTVQTFGDEEGNMPKQYIREWFGKERLPCGWTKPAIAIGLWKTTQIVNWVEKLVKKKLEGLTSGWL